MKRVLLLSSLCAALSFGLAVSGVAADGAALYKSCIGCHGADGSKAAMGSAKPVKGQGAEELYKKMKGYADGSYGGERKVMMTNAVKKYSDEELKALADYMSKL